MVIDVLIQAMKILREITYFSSWYIFNLVQCVFWPEQCCAVAPESGSPVINCCTDKSMSKAVCLFYWKTCI